MQRYLSHARRAFAATAGVVVVAAAAACGSDGSTGPDNTPATIAANGTIPASVVIAAPVTPAPSVIVKNASGAPVPNVRVTFFVTAGGGTVAGASQLTDASGIATVGGWAVGDTPGVQTLTANAGGKTFAFNVQATNDCAITGTISGGQTVSGDLRASPCGLGDGTAVQSWSFAQATGQSAVSFAMQSTGGPSFDTYLLLHRSTYTAFDKLLAVNDDDPASPAASRMNVILGPGNYVVSANNFTPGEAGPFSVTAEPWSGELENCDDAFVTTGITTTQNMTSSCPNTTTGQYADLAILYLAPGQQVQLDMSSTAFDPSIELYSADGAKLGQDDNSGGGTSARLTYTAPTDGFVVIVPTSHTAAQTGSYTLSITSLSGAPAAPTPLAALAARGSGVRGARPLFVTPFHR